MVELALDHFPAFFAEVTGHDTEDGRGHRPFPWQLELVDRLVTGEVPDVIDVPTGFGKTSIVLAWAYALAATSEDGLPPRLPRRLFFVVDRRLVVDGAFEDATRLTNALTRSAEPTCRAVAERLRALHEDEHLPPLTAVRMRGGTTWDARWLARADQAAVVVGTVDQFGSRLLFRGYGTSPKMRPIDAALTGTDGWLVIDEAHIAGPLVRTTRAVVAQQQSGQRLTPVAPLQVTTMSATSNEGGTVLRADLDAQVAADDPVVAEVAARRVNAHKPATLVDLTNLASASPKTWRRSARRLGASLAALALRSDPDARVVGVLANTIGTARAAHEALTTAGEDAVLLIGRSRAWERDRLVAGERLGRARVGAARSEQDQRLFVVATQTIEVGANLDFDLLVTEAAPLQSLIQRFGRVNRLGARPPHRSAIVHAGFTHGHGNDLVYGDATAETWQLLLAQAVEPPLATTSKLTGFDWPDDPSLEFGLRRAGELAAVAGKATSPMPTFVPTLLTAHVERWVATSPAPFPDQDPAPFLHGIQRHTPTVEVAWRVPPPDAGDTRSSPDRTVASSWQRWLELTRPTAWEFVEVPVWEVRGLLADRDPTTPTSDLEAGVTDDEDADVSGTPGADGPLGVVYRGPEEPLGVVHGPGDVEPGDRLVLDADIGGHDQWGWTGRRNESDDPPVPDVADLAPGRRRPTLRLSRSVLVSLAPRAQHPEVDAALDTVLTADSAADTAALRAGAAALVGLLPRDTSPTLDTLTSGTLVRLHTGTWDANRPILLLTVPGGQRGTTDVDQTSDDDTVSTSLASRRLPLTRHGDDVGALARDLADRLGLAESLVGTVELAARWHDLGKADPRFQLLLHDGDPLSVAAAAEPLAKSGRHPRDPVARRAAAIAGVPRGFRHEAVSGRLADELIEVLDLDDDLDTELLHHLVVSHHGWARPLLPPLRDPDAPPVRITVDGQEVEVAGCDQGDWKQPGRFERLNTRYGPWGLALLETLVRLADMRCSEEGGR